MSLVTKFTKLCQLQNMLKKCPFTCVFNKQRKKNTVKKDTANKSYIRDVNT